MNIPFLSTWAIWASSCWPCCSPPRCITCFETLGSGFAAGAKFPQIRLGYGVIVSLVVHSIEVTLFAFAYKVSIASGFGTLKGNFAGSIADHRYLSYAAFTTVGFGDIVPTAPLRLLACMEALTSFVLITWTASHLYLEMTRLWRKQA